MTQTAISELQITPSDAGTATSPEGLGADMRRLYALAERIARTRLNVVITGETGVGKDVLARKLHSLSPRARGPFVPVNCAGLPPTLIESQLFGYEKGAFTGATSSQKGLFEAAQGGTILLDEMGDLALHLQAKLLRIMDERKVLPIGSVRARPIDVWVLAATNCDLKEAVRRGRFRSDLYFRLSGITLRVPPLRDRRTEIPGLAHLLVTEICRDEGLPPVVTIDDRAIARLQEEPWPGNVRQLKSVLARALLFSSDGEMTVEDVEIALSCDGGHVLGERAPRNDDRERVEEALRTCGGNQTRAARVLGMSRGTLVQRLRRYRLPRPQMVGEISIRFAKDRHSGRVQPTADGSIVGCC